MLAIGNTTTYSHSVDSAFIFIVGVSLFFLLLVTGLMLYFIFKYNKKKNPHAVNIHGNVPLEIAWTLIPTLLVLVMFWYGWTGYKELSSIPSNAYVIDVQGQMWKWKFNYPNGVQSDSLFIPLNVPIKVNLKSIDVNHSFYIPAFRVKKDAIPGRQNVTWFQAEKEGTYNLFCAEYCGMNHSYMITKVIVMPLNDFNKWLNKKLTQNTAPNDSAKTTPDSTNKK